LVTVSYEEVRDILLKIPISLRKTVKEVTFDMSNSMQLICKTTFPNAVFVTDRFHVQKLISETVQEIREENENWKKCKKERKKYITQTYENGDSRKQLLARSRYLLFKPKNKWIEKQKERSTILFTEYPILEKVYNLST